MISACLKSLQSDVHTLVYNIFLVTKKINKHKFDINNILYV